MKETVHIVLPVHNRIGETETFIGCLKKQRYENYHLILVDDGSTDGTADMVKENISNPTIITGEGDWWWGGGLHQGYLWLMANNPPPDDIVLLINDDTSFDEQFLETAVTLLEGKERTLLLAESYDLATNGYMEGGIHIDWLHHPYFIKTKNNEEINCMPTRGLFFRVKDFREIGGFHPILLPHYASDYEFTIRAHRKGFALITDPSLKLWINNETTGIHGLQDRNIFRLLKKHLSKRSSINPVYWLSFLMLSCPFIYLVPHILSNLLRVFLMLIRPTAGKNS